MLGLKWFEKPWRSYDIIMCGWLLLPDRFLLKSHEQCTQWKLISILSILHDENTFSDISCLQLRVMFNNIAQRAIFESRFCWMYCPCGKFVSVIKNKLVISSISYLYQLLDIPIGNYDIALSLANLLGQCCYTLDFCYNIRETTYLYNIYATHTRIYVYIIYIHTYHIYIYTLSGHEIQDIVSVHSKAWQSAIVTKTGRVSWEVAKRSNIWHTTLNFTSLIFDLSLR